MSYAPEPWNILSSKIAPPIKHEVLARFRFVVLNELYKIEITLSMPARFGCNVFLEPSLICVSIVSTILKVRGKKVSKCLEQLKFETKDNT